MDSKGFLDSEVIPTVDTADRKAQVTYHARQGEPFRIGTIRYDFRDRFVEAIILSDTANTLLHTGNIFDANVLDNERARITNFLKNQGYYNFSINNISYVADSTVGGRRIDLTVLVKQYMAGYDTNGEAVLDNNRIYRIRDINVFPDYNPTVATTDSLYKTRLDTVRYRGLNIIYDTKQHVRSEILRRTISLYPNALYSAQDVKRTYDNIMRLGYYKSASILFTEVADSTQKDNFISFVGTDSTGSDEADYTAEHYLSCEVLCTPALRQSYSVNLRRHHIGRLLRRDGQGRLPEPQPAAGCRTVRGQCPGRIRIHVRRQQVQKRRLRIRRQHVVLVSASAHPLPRQPLQPRAEPAYPDRPVVQHAETAVLPPRPGQCRLGIFVGQGAEYFCAAAHRSDNGQYAMDRLMTFRRLAQPLPAKQLHITANCRSFRVPTFIRISRKTPTGAPSRCASTSRRMATCSMASIVCSTFLPKDTTNSPSDLITNCLVSATPNISVPT
ncbi:MAG: hypothetical protein ACLR8Y_11165 [Alistipes indistinctus]